jgi:hypothetical protein
VRSHIPRNKSAEFNQFLSETEDKAHYLESVREFAAQESKIEKSEMEE